MHDAGGARALTSYYVDSQGSGVDMDGDHN